MVTLMEDRTSGNFEMDFPPANETIYYYYEIDGIYQIAGEIDSYVLPLICLSGIPANIIAALVFSTKTFRQASFGVNLVIKSVSDTIFLTCALLVWLGNMQIYFLHTHGVCQLVVFLTYVSGFTSVWCTVALVFENLIRIRYPFRVVVLCQARHAWIATAVMTIIACLVYLPTLWVNRVFEVEGLGICQRNDDMEFVSSLYTYLDTFLTLIIPFGVIVVCLMMTIQTACTLKARSRLMFRDLRVSMSVCLQQQITRMLSAISVSFTLLTFPSHMTRIVLLVIVWSNRVRDISPEQYLTQHIFQLLYYLSFAINIFTYVIFCPKVRNTLRSAASCCCFVFKTDHNLELNCNSLILQEYLSSDRSSDSQRNKTINLIVEAKIDPKGALSDQV